MPIVIPSRDWGDLESPWISTDLSTWETPLRHGRLRDYQPREQVFRQGEDFSSVYIVESGRVRVSVCHTDGQEKTLYVADTGAMIGESDCILGQPIQQYRHGSAAQPGPGGAVGTGAGAVPCRPGVCGLAASVPGPEGASAAGAEHDPVL